MLTSRDAIATTALLASIGGSIYFSQVHSSYIWSLLFCFLQMNAVMFYFFGITFANGDSTRELFSEARSAVSNIGSRMQSTITGQVISNGYTRMVNGIQ